MRIGVLIRMQKGMDIGERFAELRASGMESCQLVCWDREILQDECAVRAVNEASEKYDVDITAFWCGWEGRRVWDFYEGQVTLGLIPADYRIERMKMLLEGCDFAKKIHVKDVATHVGYMPENPYDPQYQGVLSACRTIVEKCKRTDRIFCLRQGRRRLLR